MSFFRRRQTADKSPPPPPATIAADPAPQFQGAALQPPEPDAEITVSRTLVKSEPELVEQVASTPRLSDEGFDVSLAERGFGTRVSITASPASGSSLAELEAILDQLAEASKQPFTNI